MSETQTGDRPALKRSALRLAAEAAGYSVRQLAAAVGLPSHPYLSLAAAGKRPLSREVARKVEKLTGFAATPDNWPGGLKD